MASNGPPANRLREFRTGRDVEDYVRERFFGHPAVRRFADLSQQRETPDFEFRFQGGRVGLEVKSKLKSYSADYRAMWPELPEPDLFILDEGSLRSLSWSEGMGYLLIADAPASRWVVIGPWELLLGPRRRFADVKGPNAAAVGKGKLLLDLGIGRSFEDVVVEDLLRIVRETRRKRSQAAPIRWRGQPDLPVVPRPPVPLDLDSTTGPELTGTRSVVEATDPDTLPLETQPEPTAVGDVSEVWCGLSTTLAGALRTAHGWEAPTEVQTAAIPPVLAGHNTLVLAPTAGGKTEAALLPLLDVAASERWKPTSILAISPMKALLDDQLRRYRSLGALAGATAFAWHGDIPSPQRRDFLANPSDILLTTPESLEILLHRSEAREMLRRIRAVVIDEVHAMVGTARGAQLAALLERLDQRCSDDLQRIGLSATVGSPEEVLAWLGGSSYRERSLATVAAAGTREETSIVSYDDDAELTTVLGGVVAEQRTLVFVQSRRRAEHLGARLDVPVHHSSISAEGRRAAIRRFQDGDVSGLVATATLELGIDIGDVELVAQDGSPSGPASYLQRAGRSGRRTGMRRMLFTCGTPDDLIQMLAVLARVRRSALDPIPARRGARLMLGQQALALAFEPVRTGFERHELAAAICFSPVFRDLRDDALATLDHLVDQEWLSDVRGRLVPGHRAMVRFGGGGLNFAGLAASFDTRASLAVVDEGGRSVGSIDWTAAQETTSIAQGEPFQLDGRAWRAVEVTSEAVRAVPAAVGTAAKPPSWRGPSLDVDRPTWQTVREILGSTEVPAAMDERAELWLEMLRAQWRPRFDKPLSVADRETVVATFAGAAVHRAVLAILGLEGTSDGPDLRIRSTNRAELRTRAQAALADLPTALATEAERVGATIGGRHRELIPASVLAGEAAEFWVDEEGIRTVLTILSEE